MKIKLAKATGGSLPKDNISRIGSIALAFILVLMLIGQLFEFEKLAEAIVSYGLVDETFATLLAAIIVVLELAALPSLLHMKLSKLARSLGWLAGALAFDIWIILSLWGVMFSPLANSAVLGAKLDIENSWLVIAILLIVGAGYVVVFYRSNKEKLARG